MWPKKVSNTNFETGGWFKKPHTQAWFVGLVLLLLMKVCVFWGINQLTFRTNKQKETDLDTEKKVKF